MKPEMNVPCRNTDPELFFPLCNNYTPEGKSDFIKETVYALSLCNQCPVQKECLEMALDCRESFQYGIYGGTLEQERRASIGMKVNARQQELARLVRSAATRQGIVKPDIPPLEREPQSC